MSPGLCARELAWVYWMWARGLQGENKWAHLSEVQHFKSFHSSVLQFYLWKITRNVLSCLPHLAVRAKDTLSLLLFFFLPFISLFPVLYKPRIGCNESLCWIINCITQHAPLPPICCMCLIAPGDRGLSLWVWLSAAQVQLSWNATL